MKPRAADRVAFLSLILATLMLTMEMWIVTLSGSETNFGLGINSMLQIIPKRWPLSFVLFVSNCSAVVALAFVQRGGLFLLMLIPQQFFLVVAVFYGVLSAVHGQYISGPVTLGTVAILDGQMPRFCFTLIHSYALLSMAFNLKGPPT